MPALFESDLWTDSPEPYRGEMFIWAYWSSRNANWSIGLGYWCKDGGWAGGEYGRTGKESRATRFHPMPTPPRQ